MRCKYYLIITMGRGHCVKTGPYQVDEVDIIQTTLNQLPGIEYDVMVRKVDLPHGLSQETVDIACKALVAHGKKIAAIKLYREHTGRGLRESKVYVEGLAPISPPEVY